jgi:NAD(P)H-dependent FMN reductase
MMKIGVILGSTRSVRRGERVAKWLMPELAKVEGAEFELLDLIDYPLPFYDEENSPSSLENGYSNDVATRWAAKVKQFDGYILIVSEYNHGPTAVLKNALDYVYYEWNKKPVAFVSYATNAAAGIRAVEQLREISVELEMAPMQAAIHIGHILDTIDEKGKLLSGHYNERVKTLTEQLLWWANALKVARSTNKKTS